MVATQLDEPTPSFFENRFDFGDDWHYERSKLTAGGQRLFDTSNAGGTATTSEIMAYEMLDRCESAALLKAETEIVYEPPDGNGPASTTDLLVRIADEKVGVSVSRAYRPQTQTFTQQDAADLVNAKLAEINRSSERVADEDAWVKQVFVVMAVDDAHADKMEAAWLSATAEQRANTVFYLVTTDGSDGFIYCGADQATCP